MSLFALLLTLLLGFPDRPAVSDVASTEEGEQKRSRTIASVPWPMYCNYIVRVIEGPGDVVVVAAKRDCD